MKNRRKKLNKKDRHQLTSQYILFKQKKIWRMMTLHLLFSISDLLSLLFRLIGYLMYSWSGQVSFHIFPYFAFHLWVKIWFFL